MATLKELLEQRAEHGRTIRRMADKINAENRDFTASEKPEWDRANSEFARLDTQVTIARRGVEVTHELERRDPRPPGTEDRVAGRSGKATPAEKDEVRALALQGWFRVQRGLGLTDAHRRACKRAGLSPTARSIDITLPRRPGVEEKRALSATVGAAGGYTVPTGFVHNLEKALKAYNGVRQVADVMRTDDGTVMPWPTANDTGNMGQRIGESQPITTQDPPFGFVSFGAYKYTSNLVLIPTELLDDSAVDMAVEVSMMLGERIGRIQELEFTVGTGVSQPVGVLTGARLGKLAASSTALTGDDFIDLIHSIDPAYRRDPSFAFMFHDLVLAVVRKLKDSTGRYLFEEGQNGAPSKIKGVPIVINQNMPSVIASGVRSVLAGPFKKYKVRDVKTIRVRRLEERYADNDQVGFVAFLRSDGKILDAGTGPIKALQHP